MIVVLMACKSTPKPSITPIGTTTPPHLQAVLENINDNAVFIDKDATIIIQETKTISDIKVAGNISAKAENIIESSNSIKKENQKLGMVIDEVKKNENELAELKDLVNSSRLQALEKLYGYITMFWVLGFSAIVGGALVAFLLGNRLLGGSIMLTGIMMIGFAAASQYYMEEIARVGGILLVASFVGGIAYLVWGIYRANTVSVAVKEIVEMIEILKETMTESERERIFGEKGLASSVQSDITQKVVAKIREKNGLRKLEDIKPQS